MILSVRLDGSTWNAVPHKFEAGTPDIVGVIGLGAAIDWFTGLGIAEVVAREAALMRYALAALAEVPGLRLIGTPRERAAVISFVLGEIHPHDVGTALDLEGIAIRSGHHCTQPAMEHFGLAATARVSLAVYNTEAEIDALALALVRARDLLEPSARP